MIRSYNELMKKQGIQIKDCTIRNQYNQATKKLDCYGA